MTTGTRLRYAVVASDDNVVWQPLGLDSSDEADAIDMAKHEDQERHHAEEWLGVFDRERKLVVWKRSPIPKERT
jgi:hypothetical protein